MLIVVECVCACETEIERELLKKKLGKSSSRELEKGKKYLQIQYIEALKGPVPFCFSILSQTTHTDLDRNNCMYFPKSPV